MLQQGRAVVVKLKTFEQRNYHNNIIITIEGSFI